MRPVVAYLPRDLVAEVERRATREGVSCAEALGRLVADAVPRLLVEALQHLTGDAPARGDKVARDAGCVIEVRGAVERSIVLDEVRDAV